MMPNSCAPDQFALLKPSLRIAHCSDPYKEVILVERWVDEKSGEDSNDHEN